MNGIWGGMLLVGIVYGVITGRTEAVSAAVLDSSRDAVTLCITMLGITGLWMGLMQIAQDGGAVKWYTANDPKGECVIVMEGKSRAELAAVQQRVWEEMSVSEHVEQYMSQGMDRKDAMKQDAKDRGVSKREIYAELLETQE